MKSVDDILNSPMSQKGFPKWCQEKMLSKSRLGFPKARDVSGTSQGLDSSEEESVQVCVMCSVLDSSIFLDEFLCKGQVYHHPFCCGVIECFRYPFVEESINMGHVVFKP